MSAIESENTVLPVDSSSSLSGDPSKFQNGDQVNNERYIDPKLAVENVGGKKKASKKSVKRSRSRSRSRSKSKSKKTKKCWWKLW